MQPRAANDAAGIATEAWAPLAKGGDLLGDPVVTGLAEKHGRTPAQVVLRWHVQLDTIVIPKSVTPSRIAENIDVIDFDLDAEVELLKQDLREIFPEFSQAHVISVEVTSAARDWPAPPTACCWRLCRRGSTRATS